MGRPAGTSRPSSCLADRGATRRAYAVPSCPPCVSPECHAHMRLRLPFWCLYADSPTCWSGPPLPCFLASASLSLGSVARGERLEDHTSELQSLLPNSYAVFCLKNNKINYYLNLTPQSS